MCLCVCSNNLFACVCEGLQKRWTVKDLLIQANYNDTAHSIHKLSTKTFHHASGTSTSSATSSGISACTACITTAGAVWARLSAFFSAKIGLLSAPLRPMPSVLFRSTSNGWFH